MARLTGRERTLRATRRAPAHSPDSIGYTTTRDTINLDHAQPTPLANSQLRAALLPPAPGTQRTMTRCAYRYRPSDANTPPQGTSNQKAYRSSPRPSGNGLAGQIMTRHRATPTPFKPAANGLKADYQDFYTVPSRIAATIPSHFIRTPHPDFTATHRAAPSHHGRPARTTLARRARSGPHRGAACPSDSLSFRR